MIYLLGFLVALLLLVFYFIGLYNNLVLLRESVKNAFSNIDVLLKQRHEEIPKLIEVCKRYMDYEQETLTQIVKARQAVSQAQQSGNFSELSKAESGFRQAFGNLLAVSERYPELKAHESFKTLTNRISALQDSISDRREFYNEQVTINNTMIAQFPQVIIANSFGFKSSSLLKFQEQELTDPDVATLFG